MNLHVSSGKKSKVKWASSMNRITESHQLLIDQTMSWRILLLCMLLLMQNYSCSWQDFRVNHSWLLEQLPVRLPCATLAAGSPAMLAECSARNTLEFSEEHLIWINLSSFDFSKMKKCVVSGFSLLPEFFLDWETGQRSKSMTWHCRTQ